MQKSADEANARDKILRETVRLIHEEGIGALTVRRIAAAADVNVGAINYYFTSKDNLIDLASNEIMNEFQKCYALLDEPGVPPREKLRNFLIAFVKNHLSCADPFKRIMAKSENLRSMEAERAAVFRRLSVGRLRGVISEITGEQDQQKLLVLSTQTICAAMLPNILAQHAKGVFDTELPGVEDQIDIMLRYFFN